MFTGIVEATGLVKRIQNEGSNKRLTIEAPFAGELKPDQSLSHNGVCLTVEKITGNTYEVVAIEETLQRSNLGALQPGDAVNLERSLKIGDRLDGHFVQGHVDETAVCSSIENKNGSHLFTFKTAFDNSLLVEKGSVCINGVSLTVVHVDDQHFSVAIIPYTFEHTNFKALQQGSPVNIEYDVIGKYVQRLVSEAGLQKK